MPNSWIEALKKWNEGKGMWCLPKKGTKDYDEVRALMPPKAAKPQLPKAEKGAKPDDEEQQLLAEARSAVKSQRKAKAADKKSYDEMVKEALAALEAYREQKKAKAAEAPKAKRVIKLGRKAKEMEAPAAPPAQGGQEGNPERRWAAAAEAAAEAFLKKTKSKSSSYIKSRMKAIKKKVFAQEKKAYEEKVRAIIAQRKNK